MRPTDEELRALLELEAKALGGRWQRNGSHIYGPDMERKLIAQFCNMGTTRSYTDLVANADLVIKTRNHIRAIVTELLERRAFEAKNRELRNAQFRQSEYFLEGE